MVSGHESAHPILNRAYTFKKLVLLSLGLMAQWEGDG